MEAYDEARFLAELQAALAVAERVLGAARCPVLPGDAPQHAYDDKYALAEASCAAAVVSCLQALQCAGLDASALRTARRWAASGRAVTLRMSVETRCAFQREASRELAPRTAARTEEHVGGAVVKSSTTSLLTTVTEYFWRFDAAWSLELYRGTGRGGADDSLRLGGRASSVELKTPVKAAPQAAVHTLAPLEANLSWLLLQLDEAEEGGQSAARFRIDRTHAACHTPRRNEDVDRALRFATELRAWADAADGCMRSQLLAVEASATPDARRDMAALSSDGVLLPCVLFRKPPPADAPPPLALQEASPALAALQEAPEGSALLDRAGINLLLSEAAAALAQRCASAAAALPAATTAAVLTGAEAALLVATSYLRRVATHAEDSVDSIEAMLRNQLIAAVGKRLGPSDFAAYMRFHDRRLLRPAFQPKPFCFAVRRTPEHSPEGLLRIDEAPAGGAPAEPIVTLTHAVSSDDAAPLMTLPLSASTTVSFGGERLVHAWLAHRFSSGGNAPALNLLASARQFSSFIVLVGKIASPTSFEPVLAAIVKDKDELTIPLELSALPTPKEFADAVASLSPEQQRFAKAFRAMQLQSTLFGVLVLQIKPQLEILLGLKPDALTKEIELTQDLMELFITHQIPSDLLSFSGDADADGATRLAAVKGHVAAMRAMLTRTEDRELAQRLKEEAHAQPGLMFGAAVPPPPPAGGLFGGSAAFGAAAGAQAMVKRGAAPRAMPFSPPAAAFGFAPAAAPAMMMDACGAAPLPPMSAPPPPMSTPPPPPPPPHGASTDAAAAPSSVGVPDAGAVAPDEDDEVPLSSLDLTSVPAKLDAAYEKLDSDSALRPTIITPGSPWRKREQVSLLAREPRLSTLHASEQDAAKRAAFDLLDALSRSGALPLRHAALHVVLGATHCFDQSLMNTVVQQNINPIERVERSTLIMAATLHGRPAAELLKRDQVPRVAAHSPALFAALEGAAE